MTVPKLVRLAVLAALALPAACVTGGKSGSASAKNAPAAAKEELEVTGGRVYRGQDGQKVEMALLKPAKGTKHALIRISNAQSEWDGKVLKVEVREYDSKVDIVTQNKGSDYVTIVGRGTGGWWGSSSTLTYWLYAPGLKGDLKIYIDLEATDKLDAKALAAAYDPRKDPGAKKKAKKP